MSRVQRPVDQVVEPTQSRARVTPTDMVLASAGLRAARRQRGEALEGLSSGLLSPAELLELAAGEGGAALRRIRISNVFAELGCTKRRAEELLVLFRRLARVEPATPDRMLTIGWLCDRRASERRVNAFCEVLLLLGAAEGLRPTPTAAYPYAR